MKSFDVGIDSYSLQPLNLTPDQVLNWAKQHHADGVHFTEINRPPDRALDKIFLRDLSQQAESASLYLEWGGGQHLPYDTATWDVKDIYSENLRAAQEAHHLGTSIVRSCSGGLMRWADKAPPTEILLMGMTEALVKQRDFLTDLNVTLAIELHFEFTTFELLRLFDRCGAEPGGYLGICLDTMNLLTMLEDPVLGTERILPWVVATHAKDGALLLNDEGLVSFTTEIGKGQIDFPRILSLLSTLNRKIRLSVEDHGGSFAIPIFNLSFLSRFPDLTPTELSRLIQLAFHGNQGVQEGKAAPLDRALWPGICESRVQRGVHYLKQLCGSGPGKE
ncbi:MAG: sugar phosphate isomerase/epimerase [Candidatus Eisenbacteria bacterium]|uniref:Sugar phosphate isomerase/epimerase n=1 Tax=Eiseniibacteriota bacterium TaxID=2212470 RepID=A0A948S1D1_UNCEI|nr:sugar phosphate isomerase/epimerase [Candidatus Eisenbacteria bacterium]MBU1947712.1 sugar phosphate isomerase/epimerase [Candidatus Eisenbacteria bacterium]MBU2692044.1 sugar phosphate isomerase/epimerase [Candidatus Eisenbacteria bacterium]